MKETRTSSTTLTYAAISQRSKPGRLQSIWLPSAVLSSLCKHLYIPVFVEDRPQPYTLLVVLCHGDNILKVLAATSVSPTHFNAILFFHHFLFARSEHEEFIDIPYKPAFHAGLQILCFQHVPCIQFSLGVQYFTMDELRSNYRIWRSDWRGL